MRRRRRRQAKRRDRAGHDAVLQHELLVDQQRGALRPRGHGVPGALSGGHVERLDSNYE